MPYVLGLTGSIGMGKSTTAGMFAEEGVPVWDADATVHRLYAAGGAASAAIGAEYPEALEDGAVSRRALRAKIAADPAVLDRVQALVHPLVAENRAQFLATATARIVLLDIPLLFETGAAEQCQGVVVVTAPPDVQRQRVLGRGVMSAPEFEIILARQMPDAEKRRRATWVIETLDMDIARHAVRKILQDIIRGLSDA
jgi:dephospho-CoA kinase